MNSWAADAATWATDAATCAADVCDIQGWGCNMVNSQLIQPLGNVLSWAQNSHHVDVAAQLNGVAFGTKNLDRHKDAEIDVIRHCLKLADGVVSCMGCYICLWLKCVNKIRMQEETGRGS